MKKAWMVVGLQWGDEGKGAEIDRRSREDDVNLVVRCMGGNNAGHTTVYKGKPLVLHLLPSSVAYGKRIGIGAGVIVDPFSLINEIVYVQSFGLDPIPCLTLDLRAAMVMVYHRVMDIATEIVRARQGKSIGTTGRGIGPTYSDYASREALRIYDLLMSGDSKLCQLIEQQLEQKTQIFRSLGLTVDEWKGIFAQLTQKEVTANKRLLELQMVTEKNLDYTRFAAPGNQIGFNTQEICCSYLTAAERLADWQISGDVTTMVIEAIRSGQGVLIEGAQGAMLDNYFGTYPFVTSSHTIAGGACIGLGIGPSLIGEVRGITKAFTT